MEQKIKKAGFKMTVMMGVILSLYMSLYNNFSSGNFSPVMLLISFVVSLMISILVGLIVPMPKISRALAQKIKPGPGLRAVDALVSDAIYTPIITFFMILVVRNLAPVLAGKGAEREALAGGAPAEVAANVAAGAAAEARASFPPFRAEAKRDPKSCRPPKKIPPITHHKKTGTQPNTAARIGPLIGPAPAIEEK